MKTIGILGGMSASSTIIYYTTLCEITRKRLGGLHSPELLIRSIDFARIEQLQMAGKWDEAGHVLNTEALALQRGGADILILATNTMHKVADIMMLNVTIPMLHLADATAARICAQRLQRPGLMATAFTMEQAFYKDRLVTAGLQPIIPDEADRKETHRVIYEELCVNMVLETSREKYVQIAERLVENGADCLILGCTEVCMLLNQGNVKVPVFDTTFIHCDVALDMALS